MKYLKKYKLFENNAELYSELNEICEYGLASIVDDGFNYYVDEDVCEYIMIYTEDEWGDPAVFDFNDIKEDFYSFLEHLNEKIKIKHILLNANKFNFDSLINSDIKDTMETSLIETIMIYIENK